MFLKGKFIGGGGFGKVFNATDSSGAQFALKELNLENYVADPVLAQNITKRFRKEAIQQAEINHRNVIKVIHHELDASPPFFVMELAKCTFEKIIADHFSGQLPFDFIKIALFDILSGLDALHEIGIWHRDLKPQNVLLIQPDRFAISDFGLIAVRDSDSTTLTLTGTTAGSRNYSPPEFMENFKKASATSDIYSFGAILHDIFVRRPRVPYSELKDGTDKIGLVIAKCTKLKQYNRYKNIEELRSDLFDAITEFERKGGSVHSTTDFGIFDATDLDENDCDSIIDMIEHANTETLSEIYKCFSTDFIERAYLVSKEAANHIAEQFSKFVLESSFSFDYCDVLADRLVHFYINGDVATKSLCLLALLEMGASHNRWYVENRFVKYAGAACSDLIVRRFCLDAKIHDINLIRRLNQLLDSVSVEKEQLHPKIAAFLA